jgi:hypothetical protein
VSEKTPWTTSVTGMRPIRPVRSAQAGHSLPYAPPLEPHAAQRRIVGAAAPTSAPADGGASGAATGVGAFGHSACAASGT